MLSKRDKKNILISIAMIGLTLTLISAILASNINFSRPIIYLISQIYPSYGTFFFMQKGIIEVNNFCSGLFSISLYLAIIFSPITLMRRQNKIKYALIGTIALYLTNIVRVFLIVFLAQYTSKLDLLHIAGWFLMSIIIILIWYLGTNKTEK